MPLDLILMRLLNKFYVSFFHIH